MSENAIHDPHAGLRERAAADQAAAQERQELQRGPGLGLPLIGSPVDDAMKVWREVRPTWGVEYAQGMLAAQKAAKAVEKKAENKHHGYNYASADAIIAEAIDALNEAGMTCEVLDTVPMPGWEDHVWQGEGDDSWIIRPRRLLTRYQVTHAATGQYRIYQSSTPAIPEKGRPEDKAEFGSRTENLGYFLRDLLGIPREAADGATQPSARDDRGYEPRGKGAGNQGKSGGKSQPPAQTQKGSGGSSSKESSGNGQTSTSEQQPPPATSSGSSSGSSGGRQEPDEHTKRVLSMATLMKAAPPEGCGWDDARRREVLAMFVGPDGFTEKGVKKEALRPEVVAAVTGLAMAYVNGWGLAEAEGAKAQFDKALTELVQEGKVPFPPQDAGL